MASDTTFIHWITPHAAGLRQPGLYGELRADLVAVRKAGVDLLVTLTTEPLPARELARLSLNGRHFPILGMGVPRLEEALALTEELSQTVRTGSKLAFHCTAGIGRTGMMLACHLTWRGVRASDAIVRVRSHIPRAIQTSGQEAFVHQFAAECQRGRARPKWVDRS